MAQAAPVTNLGGARDDVAQSHFEESSDFANYFCTYGFLYHQKQMLEDQRRMTAYHDAVMKNRSHFEGKVVLDVGAGSGILSIWAAQAGAKKVYAVEATRMSHHAARLVAHNGLADRVQVIQATMEDLELPEKVDIIISEWMGYFLIREAMLDTVIRARDKWLKPGGLMYPSHAKMFIAPVFNEETWQKHGAYTEAMSEWNRFTKDTKATYGVDMDCLTPSYRNEQREYYMGNGHWVEFGVQDIVGTTSCFYEFDMHTVTIEEVTNVNRPFQCTVQIDTKVSGFVGWFSVEFNGSAENPASVRVDLDTAPGLGYTHWGQQFFILYPPLHAQKGRVICGDIAVKRQKENQRLLELQMTHRVVRPAKDGTLPAQGDDAPVTSKWLVP
eukprot:TRINITY_DN6666_c0_g1_i1.p2 TRINITY_DN6666_c0_g1~~TRINITY_DN6666_c0_g1_i1.p2  ORF type:complete len:397 (-),score=79.41 TRINITY_DN6666_c0_g1_i1:1486-2640(-)